MIDPATSSSESQTKQRASLAGNFDTFLSLLTTQLQNQDPLSPMEAEKFTEQLVQFTSVEQQLETNKKLSELVAKMEDAETTSALDYLGKHVVVARSSVHLPSEGEVAGTYKLPSNAEQAVLEIRDQKGQLLQRLDIEESAGTHKFSWDGKNSNGSRVPAGDYKVEIVAKDSDDNAIEAEIFTSGTVEGIETSDDGIALVVNGIASPLSAIRSINQRNDS